MTGKLTPLEQAIAAAIAAALVREIKQESKQAEGDKRERAAA